METLAGRCTVSICTAGALLAFSACGNLSATPQVSKSQISFARSQIRGDRVIYAFTGQPDGQNPVAISAMGGALYGTTYGGGAAGYGAVFTSSTSGKEKIVYSFQGGSDGLEPSSGLTFLNGSMYGTTLVGGGTGCSGQGCGTVYVIDSSGSEQILHRFKLSKTDGWYPDSTLVPVNGELYGATTFDSGTACYDGCGTIYGISAEGRERVIYHFKGGSDGCWPGTLVALKGVLYGITASATASGCEPAYGGTVFKLTTSGKEKVLHIFRDRPDGSFPTSLIALNGVLYGTTFYGGNNGCDAGLGGTTCGAVFSVTPSGHEKILYRFKGGRDGSQPASLTWLNGAFYGATAYGGVGSGLGYGTLFMLAPSGKKTTLYRFKGVPDALDPGAITTLNNELYGVSGAGGSESCGTFGCGTIYKYKIAP